MKLTKLYLALLMVVAIVACNNKSNDKKCCEASGEVKEEAPVVKEKWSELTEKGTVTNIAKESREITIMGSEGNLVTVTVGEAVERFNEIAVGDIITFDYLVYLNAEFRKPTPEELAEPLVIVAEAVKAPETMKPAGALGATIKGVVTIEALNRPFMLATVKGPRGNYLTLPVEDAALLEKLHIGQQLILTYAEATVVSLSKL
jgi:hypothetical protein